VIPVVASVLLAVRSLARSRAALHLEILALRHQLHVLERSRRPRNVRQLKRSRELRGTVVVIQHATDPLTAPNRSLAIARRSD
jgi:hypothetical protein